MIDFPLPIIGTSIVIRAMREEDVEALYNLDTDEDVKRYVGGALTRPRQEWVEVMRGLCTTPGAVLPLIVACKATGNFVGRAALTPEYIDKQCFEIQVLLGTNYWSKHLGREATELLMGVAFNCIKASSIITIVHPEHAASLALVKDLGFTRVGTKQSGRWDNGHYVFERKSGAP